MKYFIAYESVTKPFGVDATVTRHNTSIVLKDTITMSDITRFEAERVGALEPFEAERVGALKPYVHCEVSVTVLSICQIAEDI